MDHARLAELQGPDSIFSGLTVEDWAEIARRAVQVNFVKGKELLAQGDPGDMMLILTEGTARVSMLTSGGREIVLAYAEPGENGSAACRERGCQDVWDTGGA